MISPTPANPSAPKTVAQVLGEIVWLLSQSPTHRQLFISDLEWFCMPAILLEQFRMFHGTDRPAAVVLWAKVSDEIDQRMRAGGTRLRADEWRSGPNHWLVEVVAPFGAEAEILTDLRKSIFQGIGFKFHRRAADGSLVLEEVLPTNVVDALH